MAQAKTWVGLDVHLSGTVAAVFDRDSGEVWRRRLSGRGEEIAAFVAALPGPVRATYEAGPASRWLAVLRMPAWSAWCARRGFRLVIDAQRVEQIDRFVAP